jgi:integrase
VSRPGPAGGDLAGRWLSKFLTSHLAAERDLSPQAIASYRDAIRLLLTWFRDVQGTPPEKLRLAGLDRARVLAFLDWLQAGRGNSASTRNQRLAVIKSFARYTAIERPEFLGQATEILAVRQQETPAGDMGHLTGSEVKALPAEPDPSTRRGPRDMVLLPALYDTAARVQEICDLNAAGVRTARPMTVTLPGKGSKTRRVPVARSRRGSSRETGGRSHRRRRRGTRHRTRRTRGNRPRSGTQPAAARPQDHPVSATRRSWPATAGRQSRIGHGLACAGRQIAQTALETLG